MEMHEIETNEYNGNTNTDINPTPSDGSKANESEIKITFDESNKSRRGRRGGLDDLTLSQNYQENKRRRTKPTRYDYYNVEIEEQKMIDQAIKNSHLDRKRVEYEIPEAPTYFPTIEEFKNPLAYIRSISDEASKYGICKIVPPKEWNPPCNIDMKSKIKFPTKNQRIDTLQESVGFDEGKDYDIQEYEEMNSKFQQSWAEKYYDSKKPSHPELEKDYWSMVDTRSKKAVVEYANDIEISKYQSGFKQPELSDSYTGTESDDCNDMFSDDYYSRSGWNLINLPHHELSLLKHLKSPINGVNVPWLYVGMQFATFCWHNEDNYLASINYSHFGEVKQWYGVPGSEAKKFEQVVKNFLLSLFQEHPDLMHHMTTQMSPSLLYGNGIPVYKLKHEAKTFIVTFPKAFHCGFSYGFNCGEAVNFALEDWIVCGSEAEERYRLFSRQSVFSHHRLLFTLLKHESELSDKAKVKLIYEIIRILGEEIATREYLISQGVRDTSKLIQFPRDSFLVIEKKEMDLDDMRCCKICKHFCIFSAVACECNRVDVSCIRHFQNLCKCLPVKKCLLVWEKTPDLWELYESLKSLLRSKGFPDSPPPRNSGRRR